MRGNKHMKKTARALLLACLALMAAAGGAGCSINNMVANRLTGDGGAAVVFMSDPDPELVGAALPFAIKMYETLLHMNPTHEGLMFTTGMLFVMYANAFVQGPADMLPFYEWEAREAGLARAKQLYLRGHEIMMRGLEQRHRGFAAAAQSEEAMRDFAPRFRRQDADFMYWAVLSGLAAYSVDVFDFDLAVRIPIWHIMMERVIELDPDRDGLDDFLVLYFASLPEMQGGDVARARHHFARAMERSNWNSTSALVSYARNISVPEQDFDTFEERLLRALAIDPDDDPANRLATILDQRRARWLLDNAYNFFAFLPLPY